MDALNPKPEWAQSKREKENVARIAKGLKPRRRIWIWVVPALVVVGLAAFILTRPGHVAPPEVADTTPLVKQIAPAEITTIAPQVLQQTIKVTGSLAPGRQTDVASQVGGRVQSVAVRPGEQVAEGDVLLQIDTENLEIQLGQQRANAGATRAQLVSTRQQLARTEQLAKDGLTAASALEQARSSLEALEANVTALEAQVRSAELALSNATVKAPMAGVVSVRSVQPGQTVAAGTSLMTIVDLTEVELQAAAPVGSSALIAPGQIVNFTVNGLAGRNFAGKVTRINPVAVAGTRTVPVYITMENPDQVLRGGMFATGQIVVLEHADAIAVPATAVREDAEGFFVFKIVDDALVRQSVVKGTEWNRGRLVEVTSGLAVGDVVISAPLDKLEAGDKITMIGG
jgi:RND family efflux transporter MFP subunit